MRIGYVGPFGDSNFGDYAMLINDVLDINEKNIVIFTYDIENTKNICSYYLKDFDIEYVQVDILKPDIKFSKDYVVEYNNYPFIPLEMYEKITNKDYVFKEIKKIEKLVVVGGGYFNHLWNAKHRQNKLLSIMSIIQKSNELNKKIYFMGNTYGPFVDSTEMFKIFFSSLKSVLFSTRDNVYSPLWFRTVANQKLELIPDDLYFLNESLNGKNKPIFENYLVLEVYYSMNELKENIGLYKNFIKKIKEKYKLNVIFLPFDTNFGGENQGKYLSSEISELKYFYIKNNRFLTITDTLNLVRNAKFVICNRYHLFVFSIANNIPVVQILKDVLGNKSYYYTKSKGVLEQVLHGETYDDSLFLSLDPESCFINVIKNMNSIISKQQKLLTSTNKINNEKNMLKARRQFIDKIV